MPKATQARLKATAKYETKVYDKTLLRIKKGAKEIITDIAKSQDKSLNGYIKEAIKNKIHTDTGNDIEL